MDFRGLMTTIGTALDSLGVLVMVLGTVAATGRYLFRAQGQPARSYKVYRQSLGRAILLGLEFLIAGDIIRSIVVAPSLRNVFALGLIVLIRTFLSVALELEIEGNWPWRSNAGATSGT